MHRPGANYEISVENDFSMIEPYLPEKVTSILDIGCGMAGIDVHLKRKYPDARLELLDGDGETPVYNFNDSCTPYNSREATEELLLANGVAVDRWHNIGTKDQLEADLVVSLISWGFHYPLSAYKVRGFCIADIRRDKQRVKGSIIWKAPKSDRCAFVC